MKKEKRRFNWLLSGVIRKCLKAGCETKACLGSRLTSNLELRLFSLPFAPCLKK
jgi:hypothetical protein